MYNSDNMLTDRQVQLLQAIISEYLNTTEPVGSTVIVKKYTLRCSPATVRNEMAKLLDEGYLDMRHTSSGRIPTPRAYRFFLQEVMQEEEIPVLQEVAVKQRLWPYRFEFEKMLRQAIISLAEMTNLLAFGTYDEHVVHAGAVNLLDNPEFWDIEVAKSALHLTDRYELLKKLFDKGTRSGQAVAVLIGDDLDNENLRDVAAVFTPYTVKNKSGYLGIIGPARMNYSHAIPAVKYTKRLVEELGETW